MDKQAERVRFMTSLGSGAHSEEELPVITPCSVSYFHTCLPPEAALDRFSKGFPSVRVYSEWDGTFVTFHPRTANATVADLKSYIGSLRDFKRLRGVSLDSQASTMDSCLSSPQERQSDSLSLLSDDIKVFGEAPGVPRLLLSDSDLLSRVLGAADSLRLYYSFFGFGEREGSAGEEVSSSEGLWVVVHPRADFQEPGVKCLIEVSESGLRFTPEEGGRASNRVIYIEFEDISSISVFKQAESCLLIKRKTQGKNPFLVCAYSELDFLNLKSRLRQVSELCKDSRLISEANFRISKSTLRSCNKKSKISTNTLVFMAEFLDSDRGRSDFSDWLASFENQQQASKVRSVDNKIGLAGPECIPAPKHIGEVLLGRSSFSDEEEVRLGHLKSYFERYMSESPLVFEEIWQDNN